MRTLHNNNKIIVSIIIIYKYTCIMVQYNYYTNIHVYTQLFLCVQLFTSQCGTRVCLQPVQEEWDSCTYGDAEPAAAESTPASGV